MRRAAVLAPVDTSEGSAALGAGQEPGEQVSRQSAVSLEHAAELRRRRLDFPFPSLDSVPKSLIDDAQALVCVSDDRIRIGNGLPSPNLRVRGRALPRRTAPDEFADVGPIIHDAGAALPVLIDDAESDVLAFMSFPKAHRVQIHSTNPLERLNAEIKRRTNVVGIFPNEPAITRLVGALLLEQNDEWQLQRRYLPLEGLQSLADNQPARLAAVVR